MKKCFNPEKGFNKNFFILNRFFNYLVTKGTSKAPSETFQLVMHLGTFMKRVIMHGHEGNSNLWHTTRLRSLLQGVLNPKYFSPRIIQDMTENSIKATSEDQNEDAVFLDNLWMELKTHLGYVRLKTTTDKYWRESEIEINI